jgi:hypothetical protein
MMTTGINGNIEMKGIGTLSLVCSNIDKNDPSFDAFFEEFDRRE